jgi:hypothetical protein
MLRRGPVAAASAVDAPAVSVPFCEPEAGMTAGTAAVGNTVARGVALCRHPGEVVLGLALVYTVCLVVVVRRHCRDGQRGLDMAMGRVPVLVC